MSHVAVIDIGKTNAKLALVDLGTLEEVDVVTRPNKVRAGPPWPHFDVDGHWEFLLAALATFHRDHGVDAISVTTHGACAALIGHDGSLAAPILDYEHDGPDTVAEAYDTLRPDFEDTGSPRLPAGLNLGAQLYWQFETDPELRGRTKAIVTYPQYWGFRLTGALACDVSSLGCHTDLLTPGTSRLSSLAGVLGIADKIAPTRKPADRLGTLRPEIAARTGMSQDTPVFCGIHDSNASLLPYILCRTGPFSVVSTGTWIIAMTINGARVALDPGRDVLMNVNALGDPVPSARFMGGREYELVLGGQVADYDSADIDRVAKAGPMLMPAIVPGCGPFPKHTACWIGAEPGEGTAERAVSTGFYLALVTAECLSLTGHSGPIIVEGPFATNASFCAMLAAATGCRVEATAGITGTSQGAALLARDFHGDLPQGKPRQVFEPGSETLTRLAKRWATYVSGR